MATTPGTSPASIPLRRTWSICGSVCMASSRFIEWLVPQSSACAGGKAMAQRQRGGRAFAQAFALRHKGRARIVSVKDGSQGSAIVVAGPGPAMTAAGDRASESEHQRAADQEEFAMTDHKVVSHDEWIAARQALLKEE